ncbi:DNA mismatch repair protein MutL [Laceyella sediminis]|uniref:DNA mismatch repair protein MutL n=1 Tax=Laceyella sediminis TaxID=573074 RepID=A0ABX5ETN0_9BACL|nr:DNA mismatch repair endonuclease MutL [Laceyella sediminis]PRZ15458.1 DNA mismatch repair protein MutL [Laceyella sediminis]
MGRIQVLDDHLANQIAAGEVVERPASIVKELVENAIDAEATRIQIHIEEGGISLIRVSDNGIGMDREDAILAFSRHATSKIKRERDLFSIKTLGFRGEAMPSIASVARVTLTTAHDPSQLATVVRIEGGELLSVEDASRSQGTDVVVKELFYNTPARLKYLKTVNTEVSHVADVVGRLALAHPHISFALSHNQRELFRTSGDGKLLHVLHALYGKQVASRMVAFAGEDADFAIAGYVTKPEITRSTRSYLSIVLNGRFVRSIPITQAILRAYGTLLPNGRYPIGVLTVQMDPKLVDVNVHPAKLEVRLSKEKECCRLVEEAITRAFKAERFVPGAMGSVGQARIKTTVVQDELSWEKMEAPPTKSMNKPVYPPLQPSGDQVMEASASDASDMEEVLQPLQTRGQESSRQGNVVAEEPESLTFTPPRPPSAPPQSAYRSALTTFAKREETAPAPPAEQVEETESTEPVETGSTSPRLPEMEPLAQVHGTYIVAQSKDGFYLIDQHAAHERIYYEIYSRKLGEENTKQYPLLIPLTIECSPAEAELLEAKLAYLRQWGLEMEPFGGTTFVVRAYPTWFPREDAESLVHEIIEWLKEHGKVDTGALRDATAKMMSCKAAIKANRHLRRDEMETLLVQLNQCENPFTCPHGRPIFVHFSSYELEKMFKRVM